MVQRESEFDLEAFQIDYLKFQKVIFLILGILQGNPFSEMKASIEKKCLTPGIMAIFIISLILNTFYDFEGDSTMVIATYSLILVGFCQVFCKLIVLNLFSEEIRELIGWIAGFHVDPTWMNFRYLLKEHFQSTLRRLKAVAKYITLNNFKVDCLITKLFFLQICGYWGYFCWSTYDTDLLLERNSLNQNSSSTRKYRTFLAIRRTELLRLVLRLNRTHSPVFWFLLCGNSQYLH